MPVPPTNPVASPQVFTEEAAVAAVGTAGNDLTTEVVVAQRTGYLTAARYVPAGALSGANTNSRTLTIQDVTTRVVSDGVTTINSATISSATAAFTLDDVGKAVSGTGIPASTLIGSVNPTLGTATLVNAAGAAVLATATGSSISITIGSSRTLATLALVSGVNLVAGAEKDLTLSTTDTKVFKGDVLQFVSTHVGTGITDPGGQLQVEITAYGEGSD